jgi:2-polyprenyl-6-hydroxyphenyl methylase/3-demethylubiquinone-9 3-methyltransferase
MAPSSPSPSDPPTRPVSGASVDADEVAHFEALAAQWWDPDGRFRPLHRLNPTRLGFVRDHAATHFGRDALAPEPLAGLSVLDIGTGGGLVAEPMARLGATVTGIDPSAKNIGTARTHAAQMGLDIDYRATTAEALTAEDTRFDIVLMLEVVEHVADLESFMAAGAALLKPGGLMVAATLNRTLRAWALAIVGAEYVMRWLPVGTHDWNKFLTPRELAALMARHGIATGEATGVIYNPVSGRWRTGTDTAVNYMITGSRN